jgi:hypothetical protein
MAAPRWTALNLLNHGGYAFPHLSARFMSVASQIGRSEQRSKASVFAAIVNDRDASV